MRHLTLGVVAFAALAAGASVAEAKNPHPWCLIFQDWDGGWACAFDTFEQCRDEARPGNSGFCASNPSYQAPAPAKPRHRERKKR